MRLVACSENSLRAHRLIVRRNICAVVPYIRLDPQADRRGGGGFTGRREGYRWKVKDRHGNLLAVPGCSTTRTGSPISRLQSARPAGHYPRGNSANGKRLWVHEASPDPPGALVSGEAVPLQHGYREGTAELRRHSGCRGTEAKQVRDVSRNTPGTAIQQSCTRVDSAASSHEGTQLARSHTISMGKPQ